MSKNIDQEFEELLEKGKAYAEGKNILTDEELDEICEELKKHKGDDAIEIIAKMRAANTGTLTDEDCKAMLDAEGVMVQGSSIDADQEYELKGPSLSEIVPPDMEISEDSVKSAGEGFGLSVEDSEIMFNILTRMKAGEKFSVYKALPDSMKFLLIKSVNSRDIKVLGNAAKGLMNEFANAIKNDQELVDIENAIHKEIGSIPSMTGAYLEVLKEEVEVTLIATAELKKDTEPEVYQRALDAAEAFKSAYSFKKLIEYYESCNKKRFHKDLVKYNRYASDFNYKHKDSKFKIYGMQLIETAMLKLFPEVEKDLIKKFVMLLSLTCNSMDENELKNIIFIYYSGMIIVNLSYSTGNTEFEKEIIGNIMDVIDTINVKISDDVKGE